MMSNRKKIIVPVLFLIVFLLPQISGAALISSEDFEGGTSEWNINSTDDSEAGFTEFLGRFSGTGESQAVFRTYSLPGDQTSVIIEFDFYEIDTWDGDNEDADDSFIVFIDDSIVVDALYEHWSDDDDADPHSTPYAESADIGFSSGDDQKHHFVISVPSSATSIKIGFGSGLDQDIDDESWGIDNVTINTSDAPLSIPTIDEWGMIFLSVLLVALGWSAIRRRKLV